MEFDWTKAIAKNRDDLIAIVTRLFVMAGIRTGVVVETLPRFMRIRILALLRPAEYTARRLIAMVACKLITVVVRPNREPERPAPPSVILAPDPGTGEAPPSLAGTRSVKPETAGDDRKGPLILHIREPREDFAMGPRGKPEDDARRAASRPTGDIARLPAFPLFDPFKPFGAFWIEPGEEEEDDEVNWMAANFGHDPNEQLDAHRLIRRIKSLERALQDLDAQAMRLARWRARRKLATARPRRFSPLRLGRPPGWKKRPKTPIEEVLRECHELAREAWDTS